MRQVRRNFLMAFVIWAVVFGFGWYLFELLGVENKEIFSFYIFSVDYLVIFLFTLQLFLIWVYFAFFQKENKRDAFLRALIFNVLVYFVYILLVVRANSQ